MRSFVFLCIFALFWITPVAFTNRQDISILLPTDDSNVFAQMCVFFVLVLSLGMLWFKKTMARACVSPGLVCMVAWQMVSVATSQNPGLSLRRFVLSVSVVAIVAAWLLCARNRESFARLLAIGVVGTLALAYFGIVFLPELSIHSRLDLSEQQLAGDWRGHFDHKNVAGGAMVFIVIFGLYLRKALDPLLGAGIIVAAAVFLAFSDNKTSIGFIGLALLLSAVIRRTTSFPKQAVVAFAAIGVVLLFTVGSVILAPVHAIVASVAADPTYTGRTDIWTFALGKVMAKPLFGYGFEAFWRMPGLVFDNNGPEGVGASAAHAHDAYLNTAVTMGLPGLALAVYWLVWEPLRNFNEGQANGSDPALHLMYLRIWLFAMLYACLESPFFGNHGPIWFSILMAVTGLRLQAQGASVTERDTPPVPQSPRRSEMEYPAPG